MIKKRILQKVIFSFYYSLIYEDTSSKTMCIGIEKPKPSYSSYWSVPIIFHVLIPINSPLILNKPPPELYESAFTPTEAYYL